MLNPSIIKRLSLTEKAGMLETTGQYVFFVSPEATKNEIKKAISELYGVDVISVNTTKQASKPKRYRGIFSRKNRNKKAIVTVKEGQIIKA